MSIFPHIRHVRYKLWCQIAPDTAMKRTLFEPAFRGQMKRPFGTNARMRAINVWIGPVPARTSPAEILMEQAHSGRQPYRMDRLTKRRCGHAAL
jgi:hypothetical protein